MTKYFGQVPMYCVKCRELTDTYDLETLVTKNGRNMKKGKCSVCGSTKTQFVKKVTSFQGSVGRGRTLAPCNVEGKGFVNNLINKLPFEMHLPGHNFTGPGTKLNKRLNIDMTPKPWSIPINRVDKAAYHHDVCYAKHKDTSTRNTVCDKSMINELDGIYNPSVRERLDRSIVQKIIGTKMNFGMGVEVGRSRTQQQKKLK